MNSAANSWPMIEVVKRCLRRPADEMAWQEFVYRFHPTIVASVSKAYQYTRPKNRTHNGQSYEKTIDDLVQAVYLRLVESRSQALDCFEADESSSIYQYVAIISYRSVFNYVRAH